MSRTWIDVAYLVAAICLVIGIKRLSHPRTARSGNLVAAAGMAIAVGFTFATEGLERYWLIVAGMAVGTVIGVVSARAVRMTAMPQMVALFNGVGGGAAALIAAAEYHRAAGDPGRLPGELLIGILFSAVVGSVSFWGSLVAFGKLQELVPGRPILAPAQNLTVALLGLTLLAAIALTAVTEEGIWLALLMLGAMIFGFLFVLPIGGADMPVVISLLNAFTGLAAASTGFVLNNTALIIGGTLVGASGTLLTILMGKAMGRPLRLTLFGAFGGAPGGARQQRWRPWTATGRFGPPRQTTSPSCSPTPAASSSSRDMGWRSPRHSTTSATSATCSRTRASTSATRSIRLPDGCPGT